MPENNIPPPPRQRRFIFGIVLFMLGLTLLALNLGVNLPWHLWKYFPVPLIALGIWGMVLPSRYLDRVGGLWLLAVGLYSLIGVFGLFGLSWWNAWPIYVIAAGVSIMIDREPRCLPHDSKRDG
jgi:energy-converting hydrogenase Eha subunit A